MCGGGGIGGMYACARGSAAHLAHILQAKIATYSATCEKLRGSDEHVHTFEKILLGCRVESLRHPTAGVTSRRMKQGVGALTRGIPVRPTSQRRAHCAALCTRTCSPCLQACASTVWRTAAASDCLVLLPADGMLTVTLARRVPCRGARNERASRSCLPRQRRSPAPALPGKCKRAWWAPR